MGHSILSFNDLSTSTIVFSLDRNEVIDYRVVIESRSWQMSELDERVLLVKVWIPLDELNDTVTNDGVHSTIRQEFNVSGFNPNFIAKNSVLPEVSSSDKLQEADINDSKEEKDDDKPVERTAQEDAAHIKDGFVIDKSPKIMNTNIELDGVDAETASKITGNLAEKNDKLNVLSTKPTVRGQKPEVTFKSAPKHMVVQTPKYQKE